LGVGGWGLANVSRLAITSPQSPTPIPMLKLRDIHFTYPGRAPRETISGVTLEVHAGEVVALLGPNGSGKSTLLSIAIGALKPDQGEVLFDDQPVAGFSRREIAQRMALVAEQGAIRFPMTALEYVLTGRFAYTTALGFDSPRDIEIARQSLADADAAHFAHRRFNQLSSGERQRVALARSLAQQPQLLLLDEPTANADIAHQLSLLDLVRKLTRERNHGALIVTHEINLAAEFADRMALIKDGRLVACGEAREVMTDESLSGLFETPLFVDRHPLSGSPVVWWKRTDANARGSRIENRESEIED
jgi:iron complex transport system ATP-binding protein